MYKISNIRLSHWNKKEKKRKKKNLPESKSNVWKELGVQEHSPWRGTRAGIYTADENVNGQAVSRRRDVSRWIATRSVFDGIDGGFARRPLFRSWPDTGGIMYRGSNALFHPVLRHGRPIWSGRTPAFYKHFCSSLRPECRIDLR